MALIVEDGTGIAGADSYADRAFIDTYWLNRPQSDNAATWAAADDATKDGAAREATGFIDATYGPHYRGTRTSYDQGLLWPRDGATDDDGSDLPALPAELQRGVAELAARALVGTLAEDSPRGGQIKSKSEQVGPIKESIEYVSGAPAATTYGILDGMLDPILDSTQPGSTVEAWAWL